MGCDSDGNSIGPMKLNNDKLQVWTPSNNHLHLSYASSNFYADDLLPSWIVMRRGNPISIEVCRSFLPRKGIDIAYVMECGEIVLLIKKNKTSVRRSWKLEPTSATGCSPLTNKTSSNSLVWPSPRIMLFNLEMVIRIIRYAI